MEIDGFKISIRKCHYFIYRRIYGVDRIAFVVILNITELNRTLKWLIF
mgnify:CR=1 FL=1